MVARFLADFVPPSMPMPLFSGTKSAKITLDTFIFTVL